jgi:hypothetical protein
LKIPLLLSKKSSAFNHYNKFILFIKVFIKIDYNYTSTLYISKMINIEMLKALCDFEESITANNNDTMQIQCAFNMHINGQKLDEATFSYVANTGDIKLVKYLYKKNCPWDKKTCENLAKGGHLECLQYVHEKGCPWDATTCSSAASTGQLECLIYAHENGCPWDQFTCGYATESGHLECLKYAHEHGCEFNKKVCLYVAMQQNQSTIINYLENIQ